MEQFVVAGAEQDEVVDLGLAAALEGEDVVRFELAHGGAAGVLAVAAGALVERAHLRVGRAASDARMDEIAADELDREPARVAAQPLGGLGADRSCAFEHWRGTVVAEMHDQRRRAALDAAVAAAGLGGEGDECIGGVLLPFEHGRPSSCRPRAGLGDVPDRLLQHEALLEWQAAAEASSRPSSSTSYATRGARRASDHRAPSVARSGVQRARPAGSPCRPRCARSPRRSPGSRSARRPRPGRASARRCPSRCRGRAARAAPRRFR